MNKLIPLVLSLFILSNAFAADGDTTLISAHQNRDLTWYGSYRDWAVFPDSTHTWHQIILEYTMGCASGGCSDWDYTTLVDVLIPTGSFDSTISRIDTLSLNPLQIDTIWRRFPIKERFELGKVITPYGGALSPDWTRTFYFDVSDYYPFLRDSIEIDVRYQGWSSGFSATLNFIMIEGQPQREVYAIQNLYRGGFTYVDSAQFESQHMPARALNLHPQARQFYLRAAPSGHGFVNDANCAEFCERDYYVFVDGQKVAQQAMWRNDCGLNGLWPQAGTWLYDRANWCPGDRVNHYHHDLSPYLLGADSIDVDIESYTYTRPAGESPASYNMSVQLFQLGDFTQALDVAVADIIQPSAEDEHARFNPVCDQAIIRIENRGAQPIQSLQLAYGLKGNTQWRSYTWSGNLASLESTEIALPMDSLSDWTSLNGKLEFGVHIQMVNGNSGDDVLFNNVRSVPIAVPEQFPGLMRFELRTNGAGAETWWQLEDAWSQVLYSGDNLANNTTYRDTFNLAPGCYQLRIGDREKNGLSFFANNDGSGRILLRNVGGDFFYLNLNPNFGTELSLYFTVGYGISLAEQLASENTWSIFPNPSQGALHLSWDSDKSEAISIRLYDSQARELWQTKQRVEAGQELELHLPKGLQGLYFMEVESQQGISVKRLILN